ncbi:MAG: hypothetical protein IT258_00765 [Saprospiraceae bacterium]|nr:hypothetical protein [Saprospiraceae bacterium]
MFKQLFLTALLIAGFLTAHAQLTFKRGKRPIYAITVCSESLNSNYKGIFWNVTDTHVELMRTEYFGMIKDLNKLPEDLTLTTIPIKLVEDIKVKEFNYFKRRRSFIRATSIGLGLGFGLAFLKKGTPTFEACTADIELNGDPGDPYPFFRCQIKGNKPLLYNPIVGFSTSTLIWALSQIATPSALQFKKKDQHGTFNSLELRQYTVLKQLQEYNAGIVHYEKLPLDSLVEKLAAAFVGYDPAQNHPPVLVLNGEKTDLAALSKIPLGRISSITLLGEKEAKAQYSKENYPSVVELTGIGEGEATEKNIKVFRLKAGNLKLVKEIGL